MEGLSPEEGRDLRRNIADRHMRLLRENYEFYSAKARRLALLSDRFSQKAKRFGGKALSDFDPNSLEEFEGHLNRLDELRERILMADTVEELMEIPEE